MTTNEEDTLVDLDDNTPVDVNEVNKNVEQQKKKEKEINSALGCLKLTINYDNFSKKIQVSSVKIMYENDTTHTIKNPHDDIFKYIIEGQDLVEKFFYEKYENIQKCKIMGKLRENNDFFIKNHISDINKSEILNVEFFFQSGSFQSKWNNIDICSSDYYMFIENLSNIIKKYYKIKHKSNVLVKPPDHLYFDLKAFEYSKDMD